eukprot:SAG31_NODE_2398_length_5781_cov_6.178061_5_plen_207_part_00
MLARCITPRHIRDILGLRWRKHRPSSSSLLARRRRPPWWLRWATELSLTQCDHHSSGTAPTFRSDAGVSTSWALTNELHLPCASQEELPLLGRRIAVTAPRNYAIRLSEQLARLGAKPIVMSTIATEPLPDYTELDGAIRELASYDYIAFTSRNGIEAFLRRTIELGAAADVGKVLNSGKPAIAALGKDKDALIQVIYTSFASIVM